MDDEASTRLFEEEVLTNPYCVRSWIRYIDHSVSAPLYPDRIILYERALRNVPCSYKIWIHYLGALTRSTKDHQSPSFIEDVARIIIAFERAVVSLPVMPVLWLLFAKFLWSIGMITRTRQTFDRALQSLPITQHHLIWSKYVGFASNAAPPCPAIVPILVPAESATRILRRFVQIEPTGRSNVLDVLRKIGQRRDLIELLVDVVNDEGFVPKEGVSRFDLWMELAELIIEFPDDIPKGVSADAILRGGLARYSTESGTLWASLARYYIGLGQFEKARDIFEEAIDAMTTVRDFSTVFDAYASFEESMLSAKMDMEEDEPINDEADDFDINGDDLDLRLLRLENLMNRRPLLVNSVLLKQNPHNIGEWLRRVRIVSGDGSDDEEGQQRALDVFTSAIATIDPAKATNGKLSQIWTSFAGLYEANDDDESVRVVFERATAVAFKSVDELADVWCSWVEFELRKKQYSAALAVIRRVTAAVPDRTQRMKTDGHLPVQMRVWRSTRIWSLYVDLEESLGTVESTRDAYDRMVELRVATPQTILNFAEFLESNRLWEESFRAFERGLARFSEFPHSMPLWKTYLTKFVSRYGGTKLERARDLFEQAVEKVPEDLAKPLYLLYAKLEEEHGLARHALSVYDRACRAVRDEDKLEMFQIYINKAGEFFGVSRTREIYDKAVQEIPRQFVRQICIQYAALEQRLGEIDRVRGIYTYCSQFCNPQVDTAFWETFHQFEVQHGNEDTFREMLRVRRSVAAEMAQSHFVSSTLAQAAILAGTASGAPPPKHDMEALERAADQFEDVTAPAAILVNPNEIDLMADEDEDEENVEDNVEIEHVAVPSAVFGGIDAQSKEESTGGAPLGALARFKNRAS